MFQRSVIGQTGQSWKLSLALIALVIGCFAPLFAQTGINWTTGTILAVAGYAFGLALIRCPACGQRWLWEAALNAGLYKPLLTQARCPGCEQLFQDGAPVATESTGRDSRSDPGGK